MQQKTIRKCIFHSNIYLKLLNKTHTEMASMFQVTPSLLANSNILIIHQAKNHNLCYWPNGIAFLPTENPNKNGSGFQTYFEYISNVCLQVGIYSFQSCILANNFVSTN